MEYNKKDYIKDNIVYRYLYLLFLIRKGISNSEVMQYKNRDYSIESVNIEMFKLIMRQKESDRKTKTQRIYLESGISANPTVSKFGRIRAQVTIFDGRQIRRTTDRLSTSITQTSASSVEQSKRSPPP